MRMDRVTVFVWLVLVLSLAAAAFSGYAMLSTPM